MNRKRILVFGDSNSWGFVPCNANESTTRYDALTRWPAVMAARLGSGFELVEEGLSGRTTDLDDAQIDLPSAHLRGAVFNGAKILPALLASHLPLDLVIIMLGTNDLKTRFKRNAREIAIAALGLARLIAECEGGVATSYPTPKVLLVAPPPVGTKFHDPAEWTDSHQKSLELGPALRDRGRGEPPVSRCWEGDWDGRDRRHSFLCGSAKKARRSRREESLAYFPGAVA